MRWTAGTRRADSYVIAGPGSLALGYYTPATVLPKGQKAFFLNLDIATHDVVSRPAGKFHSALTPTGGSKVIVGTNQLKAGNYKFYCSLHPNMTGTLTVV